MNWRFSRFGTYAICVRQDRRGVPELRELFLSEPLVSDPCVAEDLIPIGRVAYVVRVRNLLAAEVAILGEDMKEFI